MPTTLVAAVGFEPTPPKRLEWRGRKENCTMQMMGDEDAVLWRTVLCRELLFAVSCNFVRGLLCVCVRAYPPRDSSIYFIYCSPMRLTRRPHSASGLLLFLFNS